MVAAEEGSGAGRRKAILPSEVLFGNLCDGRPAGEASVNERFAAFWRRYPACCVFPTFGLSILSMGSGSLNWALYVSLTALMLAWGAGSRKIGAGDGQSGNYDKAGCCR